MKRTVTIFSLAGAALLATMGFSSLVMPKAGAAVVSNAPALTNPLLLKDSVTGAQAQMMPTTKWLADHNIPYGSAAAGSSKSTAGTTASATSSTCTLATDSSAGDAKPLVNNSAAQNDALDLSSFSLTSDGTNITGTITVGNLGNGAGGAPTVSGGGDVWTLDWTYNSTDYFLYARFPASPADVGYTMSADTSNLPVSLAYGSVSPSATGSTSHNLTAIAAGTFNTATGTITITAPLSGLGSPKVGDGLTGAVMSTYALAGVPVKPVGNIPSGLLEPADTLNSQSLDYKVGQTPPNCPAAKTAAVSSGIFPTAGSKNNLAYYGGPIVHSIKNHIIWWLPKAGTTTYNDGTSCTIPGTISYSYEQPASGTMPVGAIPGGPHGDADYENILTQYFKDVGGTAYYNLLTQYSDVQAGATQNSSNYVDSWTDNCGYTSTPVNGVGPTAGGGVGAPPVPGGTQAFPVTQQDIQAEVARAMQHNKQNGWTAGLGNEYYVFTGYGVSDCFSFPAQTNNPASPCGVSGPNPYYCAYHGDFMDPSGNYVLYSDMLDAAFAANPAGVSLCYTSPIGVTDPSHTVVANGQSVQVTDAIADAEVNITSHEQFETVNDSEVGTAQQLAPPLGWYDAANGEIGDKCAYKWGNYSSADGSNIVLHGDHYIVQQEYSNWDNGCALTAYQGNGGYGAASPAVSIQKGTTIISVPVAGITNTSLLVANMQRAGQLPAGSITLVQVYRNGGLVSYIPGKSAPITLNRTDGIIVTSKNAGTWTPSGSVYTSAPTITLQKGWNLVAATYPNPGLMTDAIYNQIAQEAGACTAAILTNAACSPTITEIKTIGAAGATIDWTPAAADANGQGTWPQTYGNQIPFTSGMWINAAKPLTWKVQGGQCQTVDASGVCH